MHEGLRLAGCHSELEIWLECPTYEIICRAACPNNTDATAPENKRVRISMSLT